MNFHKKYKTITPWWKIIRREFELVVPHTEKGPITDYEYEDDHVKLTKEGFLTMKEGFIWGASGPTFDTKSTRRGSCSHDAYFYISDHGVFQGPESAEVLHKVNEFMYKITLEDGMYKWRAKGWHETLEAVGHIEWESYK